MTLVRAVCIKRYIDEDSLDDFENDMIGFDDLKVNFVGDKAKVVLESYNGEYWELL